MSLSSTSKMTWSCMNTKEDLFKLFTGHVDHDVIEMVIDNRNNNLLLAYRDLIEITKTTDPVQNVLLSPNEEEIQMAVSTDLNCSEIIDREHLSKLKSPIDRILYLVSKNYKVMVLMRGCPGSGKSYKATNIVKMCHKNANVDEFIFSADKFFINKHTGAIKFNRSKLINAHQWTYENVQKAILCEKTPVIVDNTNTEAWEMEKYFKIAVNSGYWIEIVEPTSEWAWEAMELVKRNVHNVPYDGIMRMLHRYEHNINVDSLLTRFKFKYNKKNQPPKLSNNSKKYQLCENLLDEKKVIDEPTFEINEHLSNLSISQELDQNKKESPCTMFNSSDEDPWVTDGVQEIKEPVINNLESLSHDISDIDEEDSQSSSSFEEASNYTNKSVNTYENDFLFMGVLNEIPEEEYSSFVVFGIIRNINEGNDSIQSTCDGKLDKSTTTNDLTGVMHKPNFDELHKQFPENVCSLILELFDKCEGNIDWILDMLFESGHNISKQQLQSFIRFEENNFIDSIEVRNSIQKLRQKNIQDNNVPITSSNSPSKTLSLIESKSFEETYGKKKKQGKKVMCSKDKKLPINNISLNLDLRKNIENKFTFGDSLYSDQLLKIKKFKENQNITSTADLPSTPDCIEKDLVSKNNIKGNFVQLVMDTSVLAQLCDYFGDFSSNLSKSTLPISVKLPEKLAEELYYCLIANVPDIHEQEAILQDEMLARKLQEECKESLSNISNSNSGKPTFAAVLSQKLLSERFKNLDSKLIKEVLHANDYKFQESCNALTKASRGSCLSNQDYSNMEGKENCFNEVQSDVSNCNQNHGQEALKHSQLKQQFLNKANQSLSTKIHPAVTAYYLDRAEESKQNEKYARTKEIENMINQNESTTLDLHHFPVNDAILALDIYLDNHISYLKKPFGCYSRGRQLTIITGRGKHSPKGIARIKPVVIQRLENRRLMYLEPETPGLIMVIIKKNSLLSLEL